MTKYEKMKNYLVDMFRIRLDEMDPGHMARFVNYIIDDGIIDVDYDEVPDYVLTCPRCEEYYGTCIDERPVEYPIPAEKYIVCADPAAKRKQVEEDFEAGRSHTDPADIVFLTIDEMERICPSLCPVAFKKFYGLE